MAGKRAAGLVIFREIKNSIQYLLLQASYGEHHWTPPKGHVDPGEDDMETALRETKEEAGLNKQDLIIFEDAHKILTYKVKGKPKTVLYWLAQLKDPNKEITLSDEHQHFKWLPLEEACTIGFYDDLKSLLHFAQDYIKNNLKNSCDCVT